MLCLAGSPCGRSAWRGLYLNAVGILVPTPVDEKVRLWGNIVDHGVQGMMDVGSVWWPSYCWDMRRGRSVCPIVVSRS